MEEKNMEVAMQLIVNGGNAKSSAFEAINLAKSGKFDGAKEKLNEANDFLAKAHNSQTSLLTEEANGNNEELTLLMVHAQDHVMNAITFIDLASEIVDLYKIIQK
ncbi:MAG: PTS lactose/cellobiose transporter subunit IIA [Liquorilactobacillus ghanensis]|uniref:PTS lactose/cellobiose transporter subunit IIA n=1 Tax=Liquorilactobacillus ghanensis TaxID=399370 RepID=UPI0039E99D3A